MSIRFLSPTFSISSFTADDNNKDTASKVVKRANAKDAPVRYFFKKNLTRIKT
jgi:hypothetical protein